MNFCYFYFVDSVTLVNRLLFITYIHVLVCRYPGDDCWFFGWPKRRIYIFYVTAKVRHLHSNLNIWLVHRDKVGKCRAITEHIITSRAFDCQHSGRNGVRAVSYTHLDVYKRQRLDWQCQNKIEKIVYNRESPKLIRIKGLERENSW